MGHANVDTMLNVYTHDGSLRQAVEKVGSELFTIVHKRAAPPLEGKGQKSNVKGEENGATLEEATGTFDL
jgi:hypothetical protein